MTLESALTLACTSEAAEAQAREIGRAEPTAVPSRPGSAAEPTERPPAVVARVERRAAAPPAGGGRGPVPGALWAREPV